MRALLLSEKAKEIQTVNFRKVFFLVLFAQLVIVSFGYGQQVQLYTSESPPTEFYDEKKELDGFSVDVARELQRRVGNSKPIKLLPWKRAYQYGLESPNVGLFTASRNKEREDKFHWIIHLTTRKSAFYAHKDKDDLNQSKFQNASLEEFKSAYTIGVVREGNREKYLIDHGYTNFESVNTEVINIKKLLRGRIDLVFLSSIEASSLLKNFGLSSNTIVPIFTVYQNDSYIMISKSTPLATVEKWQRVAEEMKNDGTFEKIVKKWQNYLFNTYHLETEYRNRALCFFKDE